MASVELRSKLNCSKVELRTMEDELRTMEDELQTMDSVVVDLKG
jgi:hypothetical protein